MPDMPFVMPGASVLPVHPAVIRTGHIVACLDPKHGRNMGETSRHVWTMFGLPSIALKMMDFVMECSEVQT